MTKKSLIIVSGGDSKYFPLLKNLVASIRDIDKGKDVAIGMLDGGLTGGEAEQLRSQHVQVVSPGWPSEALKRKAKGKEYWRINLNKPALDQYFPDYEIILWLDGDTWMQDWHGVPLFLQVANKGKLAVVSRSTRLRTSVMRMSQRPFGWVKAQGILYKNAKRARLPARITWSLVNRPVLNAGAYALRRDAAHWESWRKWQALCLQHGRPFSSDQLSLALAIYEDELPYEALPDICNYMGPWRINRSTQQLVDYYAPYDPVSVVHMVGKATASVLDGRTVPGLDLDDNPVNIFLGYETPGGQRTTEQTNT